jgi:hypothetical protein
MVAVCPDSPASGAGAGRAGNLLSESRWSKVPFKKSTGRSKAARAGAGSVCIKIATCPSASPKNMPARMKSRTITSACMFPFFFAASTRDVNSVALENEGINAFIAHRPHLRRTRLSNKSCPSMKHRCNIRLSLARGQAIQRIELNVPCRASSPNVLPTHHDYCPGKHISMQGASNENGLSPLF